MMGKKIGKLRFLLVIIISVLAIIDIKEVAHASSEFYTVDLPDIGVENIKIPSKLAIVTRTDHYNAYKLANEFEIFPKDIRANMNDSNVYICAISYDGDYEINISANEMDEGISLYEYKDCQDQELVEKFVEDGKASINNLQCSYVELKGKPTIKISGQSVEEKVNLVEYVCTSMAGDKFYCVNFKLYIYNSAASADMINELESIVIDAQIYQPEVGLPSPDNEYALGFEHNSWTKKLADKLLVGVFSGLVTGIAIGLYKWLENKKKKEDSWKLKKEKSFDQEAVNKIDRAKLSEEREIMTMNEAENDCIKDIKCCKCGKINPKQSRFCNECGAKLFNEIIICMECLEEVPKDSKFCPYCGSSTLGIKETPALIKVEDDLTNKTRVSENNKLENKDSGDSMKIIGIILGATILFLIVYCIFSYFSGHKAIAYEFEGVSSEDTFEEALEKYCEAHPGTKASTIEGDEFYAIRVPNYTIDTISGELYYFYELDNRLVGITFNEYPLSSKRALRTMPVQTFANDIAEMYGMSIKELEEGIWYVYDDAKCFYVGKDESNYFYLMSTSRNEGIMQNYTGKINK